MNRLLFILCSFVGIFISVSVNTDKVNNSMIDIKKTEEIKVENFNFKNTEKENKVNMIKKILTTPKILEKEKSIWIWNSPSEINQEFLDIMFIDLKRDNFNVIKIQIDDVLSFYDIDKNNFELSKYKSYKQELNEIVRQSKAKEFEVDLIAGNKDWLLPQEQYKPIAITSFVIAYNKDSGQELKIRYLDFDIEPHIFSDYEENKSYYLKNFVTLIDKIVNKVSKNENYIQIAFTLPHFLDSRQMWTPKIIYKNKDKYTFTHIIDIMSILKNESMLSIMSYRNFADGENGTIDIIKDELSELNSKKSKIRLVAGQETGNVSPPIVTFYGYCKTDMYDQVKIMNDAFVNNPNFGGIAIHHYSSYLDMCD